MAEAKPFKITAYAVADYFILVCNNSGSLITNLKLQKVLYYAQGWHLGLHGRPLFPEKFQAWIHGPAIPRIYGEYKQFGFQPIVKNIDGCDIDLKTGTFLSEIADVFLPIDAYELELSTHREPPWIIARKGLPLDAPCKNEISEADMLRYFAQKAKENVESKV
jgi:uncharacterized phage-associated protein